MGPLRAVLLALPLLALPLLSSAQQCSRLNPCAVGCCSEHGYCGTGEEFCGPGCVANCDYQTECDANRHCEIGCCSQHGHCGIGADFCGDGCLSTCDFRTDCDENNHCATGCCSPHGFCGTSEEHCGDGCLSTCDFKLDCDANNPCEDGTCCSTDGFCGLGPDYCAPENCVATCDAKSHCDPGYGREWSEIGDCPLNVCCSKWGFCGTTEEFCGEKRVTRPACDITNAPMQRVIGYYEGWATGRSCDSYPPENIPPGVYTHINFAFASIDPETYRIMPAAAGDPALYRRLASLKRVDPNLRIFIAIGGWAFNDPGPTRMVFSDIARSETAQRAFFASLLSFLNTYDFDGVDIDWEYPAAEDRGGREEDFFNMPTFIQNMKMALMSNGRRNGLTVTVPASYWYLRHFNLQAMERHVDWYNIMTYDLHGTWDTPESWLGNHLNTHTNLTEITEAMDLMWRNYIPPSKVVMGLAFYSRTFTASDPGCMTAGCLFDSGGRPGSCSVTAGVLTNAEIDRFIAQSSGSSTLDRPAAVKIHTSGDQWITYDDKETFQLKVDFARSQCMGGVMVWALSQDNPDGRYSYALQQATRYHSPATRLWESNLGEMAGPGDTIPRNQCVWTNCDTGCPHGYQLVPRTGPGATVPDYMFDDTGCASGQTSRAFCCPEGVMPVCQWLNFNGGKCNPQCLRGFEVASYGGACNNGLSQLACCSTRGHSYYHDQGPEVDGMIIWNKCRWAGKEPNCGVATPSQTGQACDGVPGNRRHLLDMTYLGSGSTRCRISTWTTLQYLPQAYCCEAETSSSRWESCMWQDDWDSLPRGGSGHCTASCPAGYTKIGLDNDPRHCLTGQRARCCKPMVRTPARSPADSLEHLEAVMRQWTADPVCPRMASPFGRLALADASASSAVPSSTTTPQNATRALEVRQADRSAPAIMENALIYMLSNDPDMDAAKPTFNLWNRFVGAQWSSLSSDTVLDMFSATPGIRNLVKTDQSGFANLLLCQMDEWNELARGGWRRSAPMTCDFNLLRTRDPDLFEDPDDGGSSPTTQQEQDFAENPWLGHYWGVNPLDPRAGEKRTYPIRLNGVGRHVITSQTYINGDNGGNLARANNDGRRFYLVVNGCSIGAVENDGSEHVVVHSEHIIEQQSVGRFLEFAFNGQLPRAVTGTRDAPGPGGNLEQPLRNPYARLPANLFTYFHTPFPEFEAEYGADATPISAMFNIIGSEENSEFMVNAQDVINGMKARLWSLINPIGPTRWRHEFGRAEESHINAFGAEIRAIFGAFSYLNHPDILANMIEISTRMGDLLHRAETLIRNRYQADTGRTLRALNLRVMWTEYMNAHMDRVTRRTNWWLPMRLRQLQTTWRAHLENLLREGMYETSPMSAAVAIVALEWIEQWLDEVQSGSIIRFPHRPF